MQPEPLMELVTFWKAEAKRCWDLAHAQSVRFAMCADELEAALNAHAAALPEAVKLRPMTERDAWSEPITVAHRIAEAYQLTVRRDILGVGTPKPEGEGR